MTATASNASRRKIEEKLGMVSPTEIVDNPDRANIKLFVKKCAASALQDTFKWLINNLETNSVNTARQLIFCKTIADCSRVYSMLMQTLPITLHGCVNMFHSCTPQVVKDTIRQDMENKDGDIRVLIATNAAGMGVNYAAVSSVITYGPPQDMDTLMQQIGRAGRDMSQASHLLIYNGVQLRNIDTEVMIYVKKLRKVQARSAIACL